MTETQPAPKEPKDKEPRSVRTTICLPADLHDRGMKRAEEDHRSFSNYVAKLVRQDADEQLGKGGAQ